MVVASFSDFLMDWKRFKGRAIIVTLPYPKKAIICHPFISSAQLASQGKLFVEGERDMIFMNTRDLGCDMGTSSSKNT
jgi:hypothetical protein